MSEKTVAVPLQDRDWPCRREDYELLTEIGEGASAKVYKAICKPLDAECAIKAIDLDDTTAELDEIQNELQAIRACRHENIVSVYTCFVVGDTLWVVMNLLDRGSVLDIIKWKQPRVKGGVFEEGVIATILRDVLLALEYLHAQGQIHRDVKAGNILLHSDGTVQLADFGVSAWIADNPFAAREAKQSKRSKKTPQERKTFVGTPCWMAPEVMLQKPYDEKADIWSLGITALELATGMAPYAKHDAMRVLMLTIEGDPPTLETCQDEIGEDYSSFKKLRKFVALCLQKQPDKRPSATELLKSEFIKKNAKDKGYVVRNLIETLPQPAAMRQRPPPETKPDRQSGRFSISWDFDAPAEGGAAPSVAVPPRVDTVPEGVAIDAAAAAGTGTGSDAASGAETPSVINLRLRLRCQEMGELQDISFTMDLQNENAATIAEELVQSQLVRAVDCGQVAECLNTIVSDPHLGSITFALFGTQITEGETGLDNGILKEGFGQIFVEGEVETEAPAEAVPAPETAAAPPAAAEPESGKKEADL